MNILRDTILVLAVTTSGLTAGLLAAFAYSVIPGLQRAGAATAVSAMQRINVAILNPLFAFIFFGSVVFGVVAAVIWWDDPLRWWLVAAAVLVVSAVLITVVINVPLNNRLNAAGAVSDADAPTAWAEFVRPWVRWNIIRAVAASTGFVVPIVGLLQTRS
ncbi:anthrone oxygenase family protein [Gordonia rhizosphera]|uniref:DUF1772 domain-containing protein n=1 Tax=Gordonia rhizosphera NBRC 16068 TaxID=1108045 RepID=K6W9J3_9ACTN|nr:anthrone oxygenase family protein [Gordonia rhizosphera]GAB88872.1 hypothetical protein GORHZ_046_00220 [Gordonia rhizosphera NBRC 16068]